MEALATGEKKQEGRGRINACAGPLQATLDRIDQGCGPVRHIQRRRCARQQVDDLSRRQERSLAYRVALQRSHLAGMEARLAALSPLATLERGYAIVTDTDGHVLQEAAGVPVGATIRARLASGRLTAKVLATHPDAEDAE